MNKKRSGMTLIEILLVVALIGALVSFVAPNLSRVLRTGVKSAARRYSGVVEYAYSQAIFSRKLHRIVINIDDKSWSIEKAQPGVLPSQKLADDLGDKDRDSDSESADKGAEGFKAIPRFKDKKFPKGVDIVSVYSWRLGKRDPVTQGDFSIYVYPSGLIDESYVLFSQKGKREQTKYKVHTKGLTGQVDIEVIAAGATDDDSE